MTSGTPTPTVSTDEADNELRSAGGLAQAWPRTNVVLAAVVLWSCALLAFAILRGSRHDYVLYLRMWSAVRAGANPWGGGLGNSYGPVFDILAYAAAPFDLGPKLIMVIAFLVVNFLLVWALLKTAPSTWTLVCYAIFVPTNMLVIGIVGS